MAITHRHKMSLDVEYVNDWTVQDALRELFQNAIDHSDWHWLYRNNTLTITSKGAELSTRSLLLGHSKKSDGSIGKFGEGYKLAMLVLCRLGMKPYILTGTDGWEPKLIKSRTYQTQQLVFDIHHDQPKIDDIVFVVPGVTSEMFSELQNRNLHVRAASTGWQTSLCHILPEEYAGKVFVKGLWVCDIPKMRHGYNFKPEQIQLDRDRRMVRDFDLQWLTCQAWQKTEEFDYILDMIKEDAPDVKYLDSFDYDCKQGLADKAAEAFVDEHGRDAVPVTSQSDIEKAQRDGHEKIVMVPAVTKSLLTKSESWFYPAPKIIRKTPREILQDFYIKHCHNMHDDQREDFEGLIEKAKGWSA